MTIAPRRVGAVLTLLALALSWPARAAEPKPAPQLDDLKFFVGSWKCAGRQLGHAEFGAEHVIAATMQVRAEGDGFWREFVYEEKKAKDARGMRVTRYVGWDNTGKRLTLTAFNNFGATETATTQGWTGQVMVWMGEVIGQNARYPMRLTLTRRSDKEWSQVIELSAQGLWQPFSDMHCNK
jgi:hypothetical protein